MAEWWLSDDHTAKLVAKDGLYLSNHPLTIEADAQLVKRTLAAKYKGRS